MLPILQSQGWLLSQAKEPGVVWWSLGSVTHVEVTGVVLWSLGSATRFEVTGVVE